MTIPWAWNKLCAVADIEHKPVGVPTPAQILVPIEQRLAGAVGDEKSYPELGLRERPGPPPEDVQGAEPGRADLQRDVVIGPDPVLARVAARGDRPVIGAPARAWAHLPVRRRRGPGPMATSPHR